MSGEEPDEHRKKNMNAYEVEQAERGTNNWFKLGWDYVSLDKAEAKKWASKRGAEYTGLKHRVVTVEVTESQIKTYGL